MPDPGYALLPQDFLRSIAASRDTLGRGRMRLVGVVQELQELSGGAPYAVIGGLAQILWARKTHTDDLDIALATADLAKCFTRVKRETGERAGPFRKRRTRLTKRTTYSRSIKCFMKDRWWI